MKPAAQRNSCENKSRLVRAIEDDFENLLASIEEYESTKPPSKKEKHVRVKALKPIPLIPKVLFGSQPAMKKEIVKPIQTVS